MARLTSRNDGSGGSSGGGASTSAGITDATTTGRNLLTTTDASTARTTLGLGTAATLPATTFATSAQGVLADSSVQTINGTAPTSGNIVLSEALSFNTVSNILSLTGVDGVVRTVNLTTLKDTLVDMAVTGASLAAGVLTLSGSNGMSDVTVDLNSFATDTEVTSATTNIPKSNLHATVQTSLGLADTAVQPAAMTSAITTATTNIPKANLVAGVQASLGLADTAVQPVELASATTNIPKTNLATAVQNTLDKADTSVQTINGVAPTAGNIVLTENLAFNATTFDLTLTDASGSARVVSLASLKDTVPTLSSGVVSAGNLTLSGTNMTDVVVDVSSLATDVELTTATTNIPKTNLATPVQTSLGLADTALQSVPALTQTQAETSSDVTVAGVSGERLYQSIDKHSSGIKFTYPNSTARSAETGYSVTASDIANGRLFADADTGDLNVPTGSVGSVVWQPRANRVPIASASLLGGVKQGTGIAIGGDGTISANIPAVVGATAVLAGTTGLVPAPLAGDENKVLYGDGTWQSPAAGSSAPVSRLHAVATAASASLANNTNISTVTSVLHSVGTDIVASAGSFTLSPGKTYRLMFNPGYLDSGAAQGTSYQWYDSTASAYIGVPGEAASLNGTSSASPARQNAVAYITPSVSTTVVPRYRAGVAATVFGGQFTSSTAMYPSVEIETLPTATVQETGVLPITPLLFGQTADTAITNAQTTTSTVFVDVTGSSITIPAAGTYLLSYSIPVNIGTVGANVNTVLTDAANNIVPGTYCVMGEANGAGFTGPSTGSARVITTVATTYKLRWSVSTGTGSVGNAATNGSAWVRYEQVPTDTVVPAGSASPASSAPPVSIEASVGVSTDYARADHAHDIDFYIGASAPAKAGPLLWVQTGMGGGSDFTLWIQD